EGATKISTLSAILHKEPPSAGEVAPNTPAELEKIIARCLRKDPERRAQGIADIKLALEELKDESETGKLSGQVAAGAAGRPVARWPRRPAAIAAGMVALAAAAAGVAWWLLTRHSSVPARSVW